MILRDHTREIFSLQGTTVDACVGCASHQNTTRIALGFRFKLEAVFTQVHISLPLASFPLYGPDFQLQSWKFPFVPQLVLFVLVRDIHQHGNTLFLARKHGKALFHAYERGKVISVLLWDLDIAPSSISTLNNKTKDTLVPSAARDVRV